jgi:hypothetical protein
MANSKKHTTPKAIVRTSSRRSDEGNAFLPDPYDGTGARARAADPFVETLAEDYVLSATTAEAVSDGISDEITPEEWGGPFTETSAQEEFATEPDASNPVDAEREPFPTTTHPAN